MTYHFFNKQGSRAYKEYKLDGTDTNVQLKGTAKFVDSTTFGKVLSFSNTAIAQVPKMPIRTTSFSIAAYVRFRSFGSIQTIFSDFTRFWKFIFRVNYDDRVYLALRRNINSEGADPSQDLVELSGGDISQLPRANTWQLLACSWNRETRVAKIYLNGVVVDTKSPKAEYTDLDLQLNDHPLYEIGGNPSSGWYLQGEMARLKIFFYPISQAQVDALYERLADETTTYVLVGQEEISDTPQATFQLNSLIQCAVQCQRQKMSSTTTCQEFVYIANLGVCKLYGGKTTGTSSASGGNTVQHFRQG
ncbi:uncharacterized protein LOC135483857 [Lineus longissimus]|uniref:uncharacterized protein LOC135483857 n=1 Tax=Lineus longissimus TaxID=88925 RepID=UPI00315D93D7